MIGDCLRDPWGYSTRTVFLVESGDYDDRHIVGAYLRRDFAEEVMRKTGASRIIQHSIEKLPNVFTIYEITKYENKVGEIKEKIMTPLEYSEYVLYHSSKFRISWRPGYRSVPSEAPREFGCFCAWGHTPQEAIDNLNNGIKESKAEDTDYADYYYG